jgi:hypothetical protein
VSLRYCGANPEFTHTESERRMWASIRDYDRMHLFWEGGCLLQCMYI